ncbi:hypothetical protein RUM44_006854 [Polyplax serrata]|uniref:TNFR-Cys domain-containing protein n=1 Tax=Polyplax serrata TaxID=468196 RepID=A0ABR1AJB0_POLSC
MGSLEDLMDVTTGMLVPILLLFLGTFANGKVCETNQYWSSILERCESCSKCVSPDIVIRPCQGNADTVCGPFSQFNIDWTWSKNHGSHSSGNSKHENLPKKMLDTFKENFDQIRQHEEHMKLKERYLRRNHKKDMDTENLKSFWEKLKSANKHRSLQEKVADDMGRDKKRNRLDKPTITMPWEKLYPLSDTLHFSNKEALDLLKSSRKPESKENETYDPNNLKFDENGILVKKFEFIKVDDNVKMEKLVGDPKFSEEFSTTEKFILDWQTVILGIAVSSCVVFFLVAAIYSVQHAKHWKKLINYFDSDADELRSWISSKNVERKIPPSGIYKTTTEVVHTEGSHCKYLERIIRMNGKNRFNFVTGNVYEKDNKRPSELKPLTKKYLAVQKHEEGDQL